MGLSLARCFVLSLTIATFTTLTSAQTSIVGTVIESDGGSAVGGASVRLESSKGGKVRGTYSDARGRFSLFDIPVGRYVLVVTAVGYTKRTDTVNLVEAVDLIVTEQLVQDTALADVVVVTASRYEQKASEAPASISVVDARTIAQNPTLTPTDQLKGLAGVDMAQSGVSTMNVSVRGFNNAFSGALMVLTDYRLTGVPSLRANVSYFVPMLNEDIDRMELVRGPGSALYGPNASQGVVNIISRSPFSSKGTTVYFSGGNQSLISGGLRHAGTIGSRVGYKISGQYVGADEWVYVDPVEQAARSAAIAGGASPDTLKTGNRINTHKHFNVEARMDYLVGDEATITLSGGMSRAINAIEITGIGAANSRNWDYFFANAQLNWNDLFVQTFFNKSDAGQTYLLRTGAPVIDRSDLFATRIQHASHVGDRVRLTYGGDFFLTRPQTDGSINGSNEGDDNYTEVGAYLQADGDIIENKLHAVVALRGDVHSVLADPVFSPRAALLYKLSESSAIRGTFNQAFTTPTAADMFLDFAVQSDAFGFGAANPAWAVDLRAVGPARSGFQFERINGDPVFHSQFSPDKNAAIPLAGAAAFWDAATAVVLSQLGSFQLDSATRMMLEQFLKNTAAPTNVGGTLAILNPTTAKFDAVSSSSVVDIAKLRPTKTTTYEIGYKGVIENSLSVNVDVYYTQVKDFISAAQIFTPNVFLDQAATQTYLHDQLKTALVAQGMPEAQAEQTAAMLAPALAAGYAQVPLGTVTPSNTPYHTDVLLSARNYGSLSYYGTDISLGYTVSTSLQLYGSASIISQNYFTASEVGGLTDFALNAPKYKSTVGVSYTNSEFGLNAGLQWRWVDAFAMNSGVYVGTVSAYNLVDMNLRYKLPMVEGLALTVTVTNVLNMPAQQFIGAPTMGRLAQLRVAYTF